MNRGERALSLVKEWREKVGQDEVKLRLVETKKVGWSTADQIARGVYKSTPGHDITDGIFEALAKGGFTLPGEDAS